MFSSIGSNLKFSFHTKNIYAKESYSLSGEDILINSIFREIKKGFYLDIGAHHPFRFSNTYILYKRGWSGINIDANPNAIKLLKKYRKRDINLEYVVSDVEEEVTLHSNYLGAINTINEDFYKKNINNYTDNKTIVTTPLNEIIDGHLPESINIDFLNIDLEGSDLKVLKSFPLNIYRPSLISIEDHNFDIETPATSEIFNLLKRNKYNLIAFIPNTLFFNRIEV